MRASVYNAEREGQCQESRINPEYWHGLRMTEQIRGRFQRRSRIWARLADKIRDRFQSVFFVSGQIRGRVSEINVGRYRSV